MKQLDLLVSNLCEEIDSLKAQLKYCEQEYETLSLKYNELLGSAIKHNQEMMENLLNATLNNKEL